MKNKHIHDCGYKNFFSNPVTVKQLLTSFVNEDWVHKLDFDTLERMETSFVTDEFREKESDLIYAENEFSKETLKQIKNVVSALFYVEKSIPEKFLKEIDTVIEMLKNEKPDVMQVFFNWMRVTFNETHEEIYHEIKQVEEIRTMFATKLEKYGERLKKEAMREGVKKGIEKGVQKGVQEGMHRKAIQTAKALLVKNMNVQEISEITGLSVEEIKSLK